MPLLVKEINTELAEIRWDVTMDIPDRKKKAIQLPTIHPLGTLVLFECETTRFPVDHEKRHYSFYVNTKLSQKLFPTEVETDTETSQISQMKGTAFEFSRKPIAVWMTVDCGRSYYFERNADDWESEEITMNYYHRRRSWSNHNLIFTIWVQFPSSKLSERGILKGFTEMFASQTDCDVIFKIGDEQIGGHVSILSAASPVFAAMFKNHTKEFQTRLVVVEDIPMDIFKLLLNFIYSSLLQAPLNEERAMLLYEAAHKYDIGDLMEGCVDYIVDCCIRLDTVLELIVWADLYSTHTIREAALSYFVQHPKYIFERQEWGEFLKNHPDLALTVTRYLGEHI